MKFKMESSQIFVPDNLPPADALARTTHLAVGAHQDDLEIMAVEGILACFQQLERWFTGVVVTNGSGSPRAGVYSEYSDNDMRKVRIEEQKKAAVIGEYAAQVFLDYPSSAVKDAENADPVADLVTVFTAARPQIVYTHNLADKHDTHVGTALRTIQAIRQLPAEMRPEHLYGCEVWRDLDWMVDTDKVVMDCSMQENLQNALLGVYDSQISGGKRYDLAGMARRRANATYFASHDTDTATGLCFAMDLTPLIKNETADIQGIIQEHIERFSGEVMTRLAKLS